MDTRSEVPHQRSDPGGQDDRCDRYEEPVQPTGPSRHPPGGVAAPEIREELRDDQTHAGQNGRSNDRRRFNGTALVDDACRCERAGGYRQEQDHRAHRDERAGECSRQRNAAADPEPATGPLVDRRPTIHLRRNGWCVHRLLWCRDDIGLCGSPDAKVVGGRALHSRVVPSCVFELVSRTRIGGHCQPPLGSQEVYPQGETPNRRPFSRPVTCGVAGVWSRSEASTRRAAGRSSRPVAAVLDPPRSARGPGH